MPYDPLTMLLNLSKGTGYSYNWIQQILDLLNQQAPGTQVGDKPIVGDIPLGPKPPVNTGATPVENPDWLYKPITPAPITPPKSGDVFFGGQTPRIAPAPAESPFRQVHVPIPDEKGNYYTQVTNPNYYAPGVGNLYANDAEASLAGKYPDLWNGYLAALKQGEKLAFTEWAQGQLMPKMGLGGWGDMKPTIM